MRIFFTFLIIATSLSAAHADPQTSTSNKSLFDQVSHRYQAIANGTSFYYYTQPDRIQILTELFHSIESDYALLDIKLKRFSLDFEGMKNQALADESAIPDTQSESAQALANLQFIDRARKIIAQFRDTHFTINAQSPVGPILLPFSIAKADGKYVVASRIPKMLAYLAMIGNDKNLNGLDLGDEVVSFDGVSVEQAEKTLEPYLFSSSDEARAISAVDNLTRRNFYLPANNSVWVTLRKSDGSISKLKFPWFYRAPTRGDENLVLKNSGMIVFDQLRLTWDDANGKWNETGLDIENAGYFASFSNLLQNTTYNDADSGNPIIATGYLLRQGKAYGVMQVFSFDAQTLVDDSGKKTSYFSAIRNFVKTLKAQSVPLILDLRSNEGGYPNYPETLLSILAEPGKIYAGTTEAYRITRNTLEIIDETSHKGVVPESDNAISAEEMNKVFADMAQSNSPYTAALSMGKIVTDPEVGGYSSGIVALTYPTCISACDIMANLLKTSGRAKILGRPSNGTGAGFNSSDNFGSQFTDSYRVLKAKIPNFLFGRPGPDAITNVFSGMAETFNLENQPTLPDVNHDLTINDLLSGSADWIDQAVQVLNQAPAPKADPATTEVVSQSSQTQ